MITIQRPSAHDIMKFVPALIVLSFGALVAVAWLSTIAHRTHHELDRVIPHMVRDIARSGWTVFAIKKHGTPRLQWLADMDPPGAVQALGPVKRYRGIARSKFDAGTALVQTGFDFQSGEAALVSLWLEKIEDDWKIDAIKVDINDPLLAEIPERTPPGKKK